MLQLVIIVVSLASGDVVLQIGSYDLLLIG